MKRRASAALAGLVLVVVCIEGCRRHDPPPLMLLPGQLTEGTVTFPAPDTGWTERLPLPPRTDGVTLGSNAPIRVTSPSLDEKGHFEIEGKTLTLYFSEGMITDEKTAPQLVIKPAVKGKTIWDRGGYQVSFETDKGFEPGIEYAIEIPELVSPSGRKLEGGFKGTFKAVPSIEVAGKTIHYIPERGRARVIMMRPGDGNQLGGPQVATIIFDQAIDLGLAQKLVTITHDGKKIPATLFHPGGSTHEGVRVDPRFLVLAKPATLLAPGEKFTVTAGAQREDDESVTQTFTVAEPTHFDSVGCGYGATDCDVKDNTVLAAHTNQIQLKYNNPLGIGYGDGARFVTVTPKPKNLYVSAYGELTISAGFSPSTTYTVQVAGAHDQYGGAVPPVTVTFQTRALRASATMSEGVAVLDDKSVRAFPITSRNAEEVELALWALPKDDPKAFANAIVEARQGATPSGSQSAITIRPRVSRDELVETLVDLGSQQLERGRAYVARISVSKTAHGAIQDAYPAGSEAAKPAVAVLFAAGPDALGAHIHRAGDTAVVQVFRLATGEPVSGANVVLGTAKASTDSIGTALLTHTGEAEAAIVTAGDASIMVPLGTSSALAASDALFPGLASHDDATKDAVGMVITDRGVYRPGSTMHVKALLRRVADTAIRAAGSEKVRLRILDPMNTEILDEVLTTNARGAVNKDVTFEKNAHTGRFTVHLELDDGKHTSVANETIRVAEFEVPKFKVDVEKIPNPAPVKGALKVGARVVGRYLFGAPMSGAKVSWVMKKSEAAVAGGSLAEAGLSFERTRSWYDEDPPPSAELKPITGEGTLAEDGSFTIDTAAGPLATGGPTELSIEADVTDASNRHVAGTLHMTRDPRKRHAGLKIDQRFAESGRPIKIALGVADGDGHAVTGAKVSARLERLTWSRNAHKAQSGAILEGWHETAKTVKRCELATAATPVTCELAVDDGGEYRVVASVDGEDDASATFYSYGGRYDGDRSAVPSAGKKIPLVLDKKSYKSGETAKLFVPSPYAKSVAILTLEQGGIVRSSSKRIEGRSVTFDVPVTASNAPWVHAAVTLLPIGESEADYRVGVVRVPVGVDDAKLEVKVTSNKKQYEMRDDAEIAIEVKRNGAPVKNADVTLAVVDEGVLRMTAFHAKDPALALRPGKALDFQAIDTRALMMRRRDKAHTAGGGDSAGEESLDTRKNFVETAAWLPDLATDGDGKVRAKVKLPDNLTEFRMMAIVVDDAGGGGTSEASFVVSKALLLEPVMPRFAARGDTFEAAAMVHNNTDAEVGAKVTVAGQLREVTLPARSRKRVAVTMTASERGTKKMRFALETGGKTVDAVEIPLRVDEAGIAEHPTAAGAFADRQQIDVEIPADAVFDDGEALSIKTGSALYPELGQRLSYLLDYPHGCVEQTTSSTIPIIAARTILPWTGMTTLDDTQLKHRITAGIDRLATMQTSGGGLAYWPGGSEPNLFGTAYATRAILRAKAIGIEHPRLLDGVVNFLKNRVLSESDPELKVSIAEVLAYAHELDPSTADAMFDTREKLSAFGLASLAISLASIPKQEDRVKTVLDELEKSFDEAGEPRRSHDEHDWRYWSSEDRDRAQTTIALTRLRPASRLLPLLAGRLSHGLARYTTQSTAWSLLALSDYIGTRSPDGSVDVNVKLEGKILDTFQKLGGDNKEVRVPLASLVGKKVTFVLTGHKDTPSAFAIEARYRRPVSAKGTHVGMRAPKGVTIHRAYSDAAGKPIDLAKVKAGEVVRVALRIAMPDIVYYRQGYVAITDRLPAGFEAVNPDLATTASVPDLAKEHPFYEGLSQYGSSASHVDLRDDKVQIYFDRAWARVLHATYLARATTPGTFTLPPANGELMYEPGSDGWSDAGKVTIE